MSEEEPIAEVVLSHDFPGATLPRNFAGTTQVAGKGMVDQLRASWNSLLSWLREVQAWGQAGAVE